MASEQLQAAQIRAAERNPQNPSGLCSWEAEQCKGFPGLTEPRLLCGDRTSCPRLSSNLMLMIKNYSRQLK